MREEQFMTFMIHEYMRFWDRRNSDHLVSIDDDKSYLGQNLSIPQLLHATKRKLQGTTFGGRFVWGS